MPEPKSKPLASAKDYMKTVTALGAVSDSGSGSGEAKAAKAAAGKAVMTAVHKQDGRCIQVDVD